MADATITAFPGTAGMPENPMQLAPRQPGWCRHDAIVIDEHTRTVQCADPKCGAARGRRGAFRSFSNAHAIVRRAGGLTATPKRHVPPESAECDR